MRAGLRRPAPVVTQRSRPRGLPRPQADLSAMRRAAALYLLSREAVARDVAFLLLPAPADPDRKPVHDSHAAPARAVRPGAADLALWLRGRMLLVGFAPAKGRPRLAQDRFAAALRGLGHDYRTIRAETPAHAVEQLVKLIDGSGA